MAEGMARVDQVFLNRVLAEYQKDQLPNQEQVRFDVAKLSALVARLQGDINKMRAEA